MSPLLQLQSTCFGFSSGFGFDYHTANKLRQLHLRLKMAKEKRLALALALQIFHIESIAKRRSSLSVSTPFFLLSLMPHLSAARGKRAWNFQFLLTADSGDVIRKCLLTYVKLCECQV